MLSGTLVFLNQRKTLDVFRALKATGMARSRLLVAARTEANEFLCGRLAFVSIIRIMRGSDSAPVAQLDRVLGYEPRGRAFESLRAHQQNQAIKPISGLAFLFSAGRNGDLASLFVRGESSAGL